jgi:hypothetical protein
MALGRPGLWSGGGSEASAGLPTPKLLCLLFDASASELRIAAGSPSPSPCGRLDGVERRDATAPAWRRPGGPSVRRGGPAEEMAATQERRRKARIRFASFPVEKRF